MVDRAPGPSRLVQSVARWAITLGAGGTIVGATAIHYVLLGKQAAGNRQGMLMLAGILLSVSFVLAPFVRRTFGNRPAVRQAAVQRTLLDELRETPPGEDGSEPAAAAVAPAPPVPAEIVPSEIVIGSALITRIVAGAYAVFGATLLVILWMLQTS